MDAIVERARAAESAGFDGVAVMDHLSPPMAPDQPMFEAMATSAWILANTSRLRAGALVLCDAFRHPAVLAQAAVTLDHASGGRFELGIGAGSVPTELDTFGVSPTEVGRASIVWPRRSRCSSCCGPGIPSTTPANTISCAAPGRR